MITSTLRDGDMTNHKNIINFCSSKNINYNNLIIANQIHSKNIKIINKENKKRIISNADGLITKSPEIYLAILTADCLPISFSSRKICGILHVGWKGLAQGIIEEALKLISGLKENISDVNFNIGPGIGVCHFEVKKEILGKFKYIEVSNFINRKNKKMFLDLKGMSNFVLQKNGITKVKTNIECTFCNENYFSYRRDGESKRIISITSIS